MINWIKNLVAGKELAELERWRVGASHAERWLAEFKPAYYAIDYLIAFADGEVSFKRVEEVRDWMRSEAKERAADIAASTISLTPAEMQSGLDRVRFAELLIRQLPEDHDGRNTWLLNYARDKKVESAPRDGR